MNRLLASDINTQIGFQHCSNGWVCNMNINITAMSMDGHAVDVPHGLSDLLNRAGAWSITALEPLEGYRRQVKRVNGKLVTELTFVGAEQKRA